MRPETRGYHDLVIMLGLVMGACGVLAGCPVDWCA